MNYIAKINDSDAIQVETWMASRPDTEIVAGFVPGPGIQKLSMKFDIDKLQEALEECLSRTNYKGSMQEQGFSALPLTKCPGQETWSDNDLSGRFWTRADDRYVEEPREDFVDETSYSEFVPLYADTYFEEVWRTLVDRFPIGRMRILSKPIYNCNSWHRDPEPRLHIPIKSNPGSLFIVNNHVTHLPADGSVYFTDTRGYHTALNGGENNRVHIVAALAFTPVND